MKKSYTLPLLIIFLLVTLVCSSCSFQLPIDDLMSRNFQSTSSGSSFSSKSKANVISTSQSVAQVKTKIPDVLGWKFGHAKEYLEALGFRVETVMDAGASLDNGVVRDCDPHPGESAYRGDSVAVYIQPDKVASPATESTTTTTTTGAPYYTPYYTHQYPYWQAVTTAYADVTSESAPSTTYSVYGYDIEVYASPYHDRNGNDLMSCEKTIYRDLHDGYTFTITVKALPNTEYSVLKKIYTSDDDGFFTFDFTPSSNLSYIYTCIPIFESDKSNALGIGRNLGDIVIRDTAFNRS